MTHNTSKFISAILLLSAFAFFSGEAVAQSKKDIKKANQLVDQGNKAASGKNFRMAIDKYAEAIVLMPKSATAHFRKGYAHYQLNEYEIALNELDTALSQGHPLIDIARIRWYIYYQKKNLDGSLADLRTVLQADPNNQTALIAAGDVNYEKQNFREALLLYQRAIVAAPRNGDLYFKIARVQFSLGDEKAQETAASEAVAKGTQFVAESYQLLADAYQKQRKVNQAIDAFNIALTAKPDLYQIYRTLGDLYRSQNRINDAIEISKRGLRLFPNDGNIYTDISWYYSLADRHEDAIAAAQSGIKLLPNQYIAYTNLCRAYNDTKQYQFAITACNNALRLNPNDGETFFYLGYANSLLGKQAEATRYFDRAVTGLIEYTKNNPDYTEGFYLLGNAYYADNQPEKAIEAYKKCLELSPRFAKAKYNLGKTQVRLKNKIAALEQYNSLLPLDNDLAQKLKLEIDKL